MKHEKLKLAHDRLEKRIIKALLNEIAHSKHFSEHVSGQKALKVNVFDYVELVNIDGELVFLDEGGYQYSLYAEASLEDLLDILSVMK